MGGKHGTDIYWEISEGFFWTGDNVIRDWRSPAVKDFFSSSYFTSMVLSFFFWILTFIIYVFIVEINLEKVFIFYSSYFNLAVNLEKQFSLFLNCFLIPV